MGARKQHKERGDLLPAAEHNDRPEQAFFEHTVDQLFNKPHTVSAMIIGGAILIYVAWTRGDAGLIENSKFGIIAACLVFLLFSALQMRDGLFFRPHPAFWRMIMGAAVLYLMALVFILFQNKHDARELLRYIDPKLGIKLPERNYAEQCDLYTPNDPTSSFRNLWDTINDEFIWAHLIGWWGKAVLLRDLYVCWFASILFEIWEMTFEFMLPNFKECWWDHIILDILICNGLGIFLGLATCRALKMKTYNWSGLSRFPTTKDRFWRAVQQFSPAAYDEYHWEILANWKRFVAVIIVIGVLSIVELNAFFLKYLLWIPPPHPINVWRLLMWSSMGMPALREYYQFVTDPNTKRFGTMAWLCCAVCALEVLICIKFGQGEFPDPAPRAVVWGWGIAVAVVTVGATSFFVLKKNVKPSPPTPKMDRKAETAQEYSDEDVDAPVEVPKPFRGMKARKAKKV
eukprot:TRINITY_DN4292_c0_g1_i2.p1 TRINITY_DN4292_c0_g1~~TRINITY_DN4292_c0_g1_i2.p1  ORF type:complete len:458 (-),score=145.06 TRINITY_DN4292_c0_g1_i2:34-1407(-)